MQSKRSYFRKFVRKLYLNNTLRFINGKSIDFGCGIGELLKLLPKGSIGFEVNKATVKYCKRRNLNVYHYNPEKDNYRFEDIKRDAFETFIMCHVLEHLKNPTETLQKIMDSCSRLNISRIVIIVPGHKGFLYDRTHRTFINKFFIKKNKLEKTKFYKLTDTKYFPFNLQSVGNVLTHNESIFVFDKINKRHN